MTCSGEGSNNCLKCENNLYFYEGQCLVECPAGFYPDSSLFICHSCPSTCLTCTSRNFFSFFFPYIFSLSIKNSLATKCVTCTSEYSLYGGECVGQCPDGFTSNNAICSRTFLFFFIFLILCYSNFLIFIYLKTKITETQKQTQNQGNF